MRMRTSSSGTGGGSIFNPNRGANTRAIPSGTVARKSVRDTTAGTAIAEGSQTPTLRCRFTSSSAASTAASIDEPPRPSLWHAWGQCRKSSSVSLPPTGWDPDAITVSFWLHSALERRPSREVRGEFRALWAEGGSVEPMVADWRATLDELCRMPEVDSAAIGWYGISMGTAYRLPFVAAEPRIRAAVLGMWGTSRVNSRRLVDDARRVSVPVLFQQKQDDEFFTPDGQVEIYEALASPEKQLAVYQGGHVDPAGLQLFDLIAFLTTRLQPKEGPRLSCRTGMTAP